MFSKYHFAAALWLLLVFVFPSSLLGFTITDPDFFLQWPEKQQQSSQTEECQHTKTSLKEESSLDSNTNISLKEESSSDPMGGFFRLLGNLTLNYQGLYPRPMIDFCKQAMFYLSIVVLFVCMTGYCLESHYYSQDPLCKVDVLCKKHPIFCRALVLFYRRVLPVVLCTVIIVFLPIVLGLLVLVLCIGASVFICAKLLLKKRA